MLFNTPDFAVLMALVLALYFPLRTPRLQNPMLLIASYVFYGWWDVRFLSLIVLSTVIDYVCGLKVHRATQPRLRKRYLIVSLVGNLTILGFFKYFDFFAGRVQALLVRLGLVIPPTGPQALPRR